MFNANTCLYVVVPYFNFNNEINSELNLTKLIQDFKEYTNTKLVIVEGVTTNSKKLNFANDSVFKHITVHYDDILWVKENLINIALADCSKWKYAAWVDKDVVFESKTWAIDVIDKLKEVDILQPYSNCICLNEFGHVSETDTGYFNKKEAKQSGMISFCCGALKEGPGKGAAMHPGQAWAITKTFYSKTKKLFDLAIVGGGDGVIVEAIRQNKNHYIYKYYGQPYFDFCDKFKGVKIGYVPGTIYHRYHGDLKDRKYIPRMNLFTERKFTLIEDLEICSNKTVKLTERGRNHKKFIENFFETKNRPVSMVDI
jgi:hypothetical protein